MTRILSVLLGLTAVLYGIYLGSLWFPLVVSAFKACLPLLLILFGFIALISGLAELRDYLKDKRVNS